MIINLVLFFIPKRQEIYRLYLIKKRKKLAYMRLNSNSVKSKNNPSDLNSLISNGVYACGDISSIKNLPSSMTTSGILIVFSNQPYIGQIIFSHVFFIQDFQRPLVMNGMTG